MNTRKRIAALLGAAAVALAVAVPTFAGENWATVTGHAPQSPESNEAAFWGEDCVKLNAGEGDLGLEQDTFTLAADYGLVVVKAGSGEFANTLFANASAGEVVWADTNGNNVFDDEDHAISHMIFCDEVEETEPPTAPPTEAPTGTPFQSVFEETDAPTETPFQSVEGDTDEPSEPDTATIGGSKDIGSPADGAWLLVVALGVLLASIVVLTPARAKAPRR